VCFIIIGLFELSLLKPAHPAVSPGNKQRACSVDTLEYKRNEEIDLIIIGMPNNYMLS
jgi:hypothetical protein